MYKARVSRKISSPSTVEEIRRASAAILGYTTRNGASIGGARGAGRELSNRANDVVMSISSIFNMIYDSLLKSAQYELESIEWKIMSESSHSIIPETLLLTRGSSVESSGFLTVLEWERGIVDPRKLILDGDAITRKMNDIDIASEVSGLSDEQKQSVLSTFADRFATIIYSNVMDREYQEDYDSKKLRISDVDVDLEVRGTYLEDYSFRPAASILEKIDQIKLIDPFNVPSKTLQHLRTRLFGLGAIQNLAIYVPSAGREILDFINKYSYTQEEIDVIKIAIEGFMRYIDFSNLNLKNINTYVNAANEFAEELKMAIESFKDLAEEHLRSGFEGSPDEHITKLQNEIKSRGSEFDGVKRGIALLLAQTFIKSYKVLDESNKFKAWQLKGTLIYLTSYAQKVASYFPFEIKRFLIMSMTKSIIDNIVNEIVIESDDTSSVSDIISERLKNYFDENIFSELGRVDYYGNFDKDPVEISLEILSRVFDKLNKLKIDDLITLEEFVDISLEKIENDKSIVDRPGVSASDIEDAKRLLNEIKSRLGGISPYLLDLLSSRETISKLLDLNMNIGNSSEFASAMSIVSQDFDISESESHDIQNLLSIFGKMNIDGDIVQILNEWISFVKKSSEQIITLEETVSPIVEKAKLLRTTYDKMIKSWEEEVQKVQEENERRRWTREKEIQQIYENAMKKAMEEKKKLSVELQQAKDLYQAQVRAALEIGEEPPPQPEFPDPSSIHIPTLDEIRLSYVIPDNLKDLPLPPEPRPPERLFTFEIIADVIGSLYNEISSERVKIQRKIEENIKALKDKTLPILSELGLTSKDDMIESIIEHGAKALGNLYVQCSIVRLRDKNDQSLKYIIEYEFKDGIMIMRAGNNYFRRA